MEVSYIADINRGVTCCRDDSGQFWDVTVRHKGQVLRLIWDVRTATWVPGKDLFIAMLIDHTIPEWASEQIKARS